MTVTCGLRLRKAAAERATRRRSNRGVGAARSARGNPVAVGLRRSLTRGSRQHPAPTKDDHAKASSERRVVDEAAIPVVCSGEPMVVAAPPGDDVKRPPMRDLLDMLSDSQGAPSAPPFRPIDRPLCDWEGPDGPCSLRAVLDELTLTYSIVERAADGETRRLRRHVPSLREARRWAVVYREGRSLAAGRPRQRRRTRLSRRVGAGLRGPQVAQSRLLDSAPYSSTRSRDTGSTHSCRADAPCQEVTVA
jgi:hypothetical protein